MTDENFGNPWGENQPPPDENFGNPGGENQPPPNAQGAPVEFAPHPDQPVTQYNPEDIKALVAKLNSMEAEIASLRASKGPSYTGPIPQTKAWGHARQRTDVEFWPVDSTLEFEHDHVPVRNALGEGEIVGTTRSPVPGAGVEHAGNAVLIRNSAGVYRLISRADFERDYEEVSK